MEAQAIAEMLGGRKVLGKTIRQAGDLDELVRKGLPAASLLALAEQLHFGQATLSRMLGIAQRTLTRRLATDAALTRAESDRTLRLARVYAHAVKMIGNREKAAGWMNTPNRALGGEKPLDMLETDPGSKMVEDVLGRIAFGVYS